MSLELLDKHCFDTIDNTPDDIIPWYVVAVYAYYEHDTSIITDRTFKKIGTKISTNWEKLEHPYKEYLDNDSVTQTVKMKQDGEYPKSIKVPYEQLLILLKSEGSKNDSGTSS